MEMFIPQLTIWSNDLEYFQINSLEFIVNKYPMSMTCREHLCFKNFDKRCLTLCN